MSGAVAIFDTTLRDGEQSPGCSMNRAEKLRLARQLETLGVDVLEAGFPIASPGEFDAVHAIASEVRGCQVAALARAKEADIVAAGRALEGASRPRLHVFLATSAIHLKYKLRIGPDECLKQAVAGIRLARTFSDDVEFSPEDASRTDYGFLRDVLRAVTEAGATVLNIPDTVGYALPEEYGALIARLREDVPGPVISVHCHNDLGLAVANSLAAVRAGARQVEGTINGIGERAGNTSLEEFVMALRVRPESYGVHTNIRTEEIAPTSQLLASITGVWPQPNKAVVGRNAFAHEAGIHQHGVLANPLCYEIMTPASVGAGESQLVLGKHSGRHAVGTRLRGLGLVLSDQEVEALTTRVKDLADGKKFVYDEDLLDLVAHVPEHRARLVRYQTLSGNQLMPTATVEIEVDGQRRSASAVGNGPLDAALRATDAALGLDVQLLELHTRAVTAGKDAMAEVVVRIRHGHAEATGQAASTDSIEASLKAYLSALGSVRGERAVAKDGPRAVRAGAGAA
ncbi:MAG TPA: 2-isopropylmalate synthase [Vicinamibacteria bacterium]|nr:2-isopropylmalate synthase [Vicinamibacteria bacterium]